MKNPYDEFAREWDENRRKPLSVLGLFLPLLKPDDAVLDAGCGNARNLVELARRCRNAVGIDSSPKMLMFARKNVASEGLKNVELQEADVSSTSLPSSSFDKIFCLAVLHHLPNEAARLAAFREMRRLLKPSGLLLVSVWNYEQKKFAGGARDRMVAWNAGKTRNVERYYHFFSEGELQSLAEEAGFAVKEVFFELKGKRHGREGASNLCAVLAPSPNG